MNIRHYIIALLLLFGCIISMSAAAVSDVRSVVRQDGAVVESTDYYPYGTPFTTANSVQPYKYGTKELDRMHGLDLYDSQARWYDSLTGRNSTLDPKAEKYYSFSPYTWCAGNPVRFVDPDGEDVWEINRLGIIYNMAEDKTQDAIYVVDDQGNRTYTIDNDGNKCYNSIIFDYGTIESCRRYDDSQNGYDVYKLHNDSNSLRLFEFLASNTSVEWSYAKLGESGDNGLSFITSSHNSNTETGMMNLVENQLKFGYTFRELIHSHPSNLAYPSGINGSSGDILNAEYIQYTTKQVPIFRIFLPKIGKYITYRSNSSPHEFGLPSVELDTMTVTP